VHEIEITKMPWGNDVDGAQSAPLVHGEVVIGKLGGVLIVLIRSSQGWPTIFDVTQHRAVPDPRRPLLYQMHAKSQLHWTRRMKCHATHKFQCCDHSNNGDWFS
jgi:hypothetical protein